MTEATVTPKPTKKTQPNRRGQQPGPKKGEVRPKSKGSKYSKKRKGQKKAVPPLKRGEPAFLYYVEGTDIRATKTPCEHTAEDRAERKFSESSLGTWRNPLTNKKCKVVRVKNKQEETGEAEAQT